MKTLKQQVVEVLNDNLWLCDECTVAAVNDDYTGIDYYLSGKEADDRVKEITKGLKSLGVGLCIGEDEEEYSTKRCDCCRTHFDGRRHQFILLG